MTETCTPPSEVTVHDESLENPAYAFMLSRLDYPDFPVPMGVYRALAKPAYADLLAQQKAKALAVKGLGEIDKLLRSGDTWTVGSGSNGTS